MGRHRDNYNSSHFDAVVSGKKRVAELQDGSHHGGDANSQLVGSSVLVWTEGDADMTFALSFPPKAAASLPNSESAGTANEGEVDLGRDH